MKKVLLGLILSLFFISLVSAISPKSIDVGYYSEIDGDYIVYYKGNFISGFTVMLYDIPNDTYTTILSGKKSIGFPKIHGDNVVFSFANYNDTGNHLALYKINSQELKNLTEVEEIIGKVFISSRDYDVYNNKIYFMSFELTPEKTNTFYNHIYEYDIPTGESSLFHKKRTLKSISSSFEANDGKLIYNGFLNPTNIPDSTSRKRKFEINLLNLLNNKKKTISKTDEFFIARDPKISEDHAVWYNCVTSFCFGDNFYQIYLYNFIEDEISQLTFNNTHHLFPTIYDDKIVWVEGDSLSSAKTSNLTLFNLSDNSSQTLNSVGTGFIRFPDLYKDKLTYFKDFRIYLLEI